MRTMTATEASRSFAALLDDAERGETVVITRGARRIATIGPVDLGNGAEFIALLGADAVDDDFSTDIEAARNAVVLDEPAWPAE